MFCVNCGKPTEGEQTLCAECAAQQAPVQPEQPIEAEKYGYKVEKRIYENEIRYGTPHNFKTVRTNDFEQALRMYNKIKKFAENHGLVWIISMWYNGWLEKSTTVNGEVVTYEELLNR